MTQPGAHVLELDEPSNRSVTQRRELDFESDLTTVSRFGTIRCTAPRRELDFESDLRILIGIQ